VGRPGIHVGGPDIEPNGLALCALHHKMFDLGAFTVEPAEYRVVVFSQLAIAGDRGADGALRHHGPWAAVAALLPPQQVDMRPAAGFFVWNLKNVFKAPGRAL
jgi:putative restriction endonuclease